MVPNVICVLSVSVIPFPCCNSGIGTLSLLPITFPWPSDCRVRRAEAHLGYETHRHWGIQINSDVLFCINPLTCTEISTYGRFLYFHSPGKKLPWPGTNPCLWTYQHNASATEPPMQNFFWTRLLGLIVASNYFVTQARDDEMIRDTARQVCLGKKVASAAFTWLPYSISVCGGLKATPP